jgi:hypothetical protein
MRVWCPRCNQGWCRRVVFRQTGATAYVCEECEALWRDIEDVGRVRWEQLDDYLKSENITQTQDIYSSVDTD